MTAIEQETAEINAGKRMKEFLDDPIVRSGFVELEQRYFVEFKEADTEEKRTAVWARLAALTDIAAKMRGLHDRGKLAEHNRSQRDKTEERQAQRTRR